MGEKVRRNIYIDKDKWDSLPNYIDCSRSEWIEKQITRQINCNDSIKELEMKIERFNQSLQDIQFEKKTAEDKLNQMKIQRELNNKNFELIEEAMSLIRLINENEKAIEESRIKYIANQRKISFNILLEKAESDKNIKLIK